MQYINSLYSICIPFGIVNDLEMTSYIQEHVLCKYHANFHKSREHPGIEVPTADPGPHPHESQGIRAQC